VVLRHSISSLLLFYDLVVKSCISVRSQKGESFSLPFITDLDYDNMSYHTQKSDINDLIGSDVLSVLITDEQFEAKHDIEVSTRGARYDGIISFGDQLSLIIENKPKSFNVWEEQLSPNLSELSQRINLYPVPAIITWKEIIKNLNSCISSEMVSGSEKIIISDFLDFVDRNFSFLNPYENLVQCKSDPYLIDRRIKNIFSDLAKNDEYFGYHNRWKTYYFETGFKEIRMVGLEKKMYDDGNYSLRVSLYYADTMNQARHYFRANIPFEYILKLKNRGWIYKPHFHVSSINSHLIWFDTWNEYERDYYNYWLDNKDKINQLSKDDLLKFLSTLKRDNIITIDDTKEQEIDNVIVNTNRSIFNLCPGFALFYPMSSQEAEKLDFNNELLGTLREKFEEGLSVLNREIFFMK
jgi:hypothetical protein